MQRSPACAAAAAALSTPGEPTPWVFHERVVDHKVVKKLGGGVPVYAVVGVEMVKKGMRKEAGWVVVGTTHLMFVGEKSLKLKKAMRLGEIHTVVLDNEKNWCLVKPTTVSGEPSWLWVWGVSGSAATNFLGALYQAQRPVTQDNLANLVFRTITTSELQLKPMKTTLQLKSRLRELSTVSPQHIEECEDEALEYYETCQVEVLHTLHDQQQKNHTLSTELVQRQQERTVVTVILAGVICGFEGVFKCHVAGHLIELERIALDEQKIIFETKRLQAAVGAVTGHASASTQAIGQIIYKDSQLLGVTPYKNFSKRAVVNEDYNDSEEGTVPPVFIDPIFKKFEKLRPTRRHIPRGVSIAHTPGTRPVTQRVRSDPTMLLLTHPSWSPGEATNTPTSTIYAAFAERGAHIESHRWVTEALLEIRLTTDTPHPKAMAAAISAGYICYDPMCNHLLLDV